MSIRDQVIQSANSYGVDPNLALAVARQESGFNPNALSNRGAIGVFQLMPSTAKELGVDPYDTADNIDGGVRYLKQQLDTFGDPALALAAYNAGPGAVRKAGGVPNYPETRDYVSSVMGSMDGGTTYYAPTSGNPTDATIPHWFWVVGVGLVMWAWMGGK